MDDETGPWVPPWEDVEAARGTHRLQLEHPVADGKRRYLANAKVCPACQAGADALAWFYFESPDATWENLCGCAGWITVCDECQRVVDFFRETVS